MVESLLEYVFAFAQVMDAFSGGKAISKVVQIYEEHKISEDPVRTYLDRQYREIEQRVRSANKPLF